ncbi:hypothetical protein GCM10010404_23570 [Nonomuraea africana]
MYKPRVADVAGGAVGAFEPISPFAAHFTRPRPPDVISEMRVGRGLAGLGLLALAAPGRFGTGAPCFLIVRRTSTLTRDLTREEPYPSRFASPGPSRAMLSMALLLREQKLSLRDIALRLVITKGKKKGQHPSPATVLRLLREHDESAASTRQL